MVDLAPLITTAQRLLKENGRPVTFIRHDQSEQDVAKPWLGPTDARATPALTRTVDAVFVSPSEADKLGLASRQSDLIQNSEAVMIISPGEVDLTQFQEVLDETIYWKITDMEILRPGKTLALAFVGVAR